MYYLGKGNPVSVSSGGLDMVVLNALRAKFEAEEREGTHVSDLVFPRKTWFAKHYPKPITDEECLYFIAGRAHHEIVESLIADETLQEVQVEWMGVKGTIDCLKNGRPVEFKTTRSAKMYTAGGKNEPCTIPDHYLLQLGMYVAMMNPGESTGWGHLLVLYLSQQTRNGGRRRFLPRLVAYDAFYSDLAFIREEILLRKKMVETPTEPPPMETCEPWLCVSCRYRGDRCEGIGRLEG